MTGGDGCRARVCASRGSRRGRRAEARRGALVELGHRCAVAALDGDATIRRAHEAERRGRLGNARAHVRSKRHRGQRGLAVVEELRDGVAALRALADPRGDGVAGERAHSFGRIAADGHDLHSSNDKRSHRRDRPVRARERLGVFDRVDAVGGRDEEAAAVLGRRGDAAREHTARDAVRGGIGRARGQEGEGEEGQRVNGVAHGESAGGVAPLYDVIL